MWDSSLVLLAVAGLVAGVANTVAGGGSLLTLPALMACGLPANAANATNRVGVLVQSLSASGVYAREKALDVRGTGWISLPTVVGALLGAQISVEIDEWWFRRVIALVMCGVLVSLFVQPKRWLESSTDRNALGSLAQTALFFGVGLYAGFIQAGVGVLFLVALVWGRGKDLVEANGMKVLLVALLTIPALGLFLVQDLVWWKEGCACAVGQLFGGVVGARLTLSWGAGFVRWLLAVVVVVSVIHLFGWM